MEKKIIEADGDYFISDDGNVRHADKILKVRLTKNGYGRISYKRNNKYVDRYIHRLVAKYFIPNPNNYPCVNHIDGNKLNNCVKNLEWCSYEMNMKHASSHGLINRDSEKRRKQCKINQVKATKANSHPMVEYDEQGNYVREYPSGTNALYRLSYKGHYFRDANILKELHGYIPKSIVIRHILLARSHNRKIFIGEKDGIETEYNKLSELPSTREQFYFAYNHQIPDKNGYLWQVLVHI